MTDIDEQIAAVRRAAETRKHQAGTQILFNFAHDRSAKDAAALRTVLAKLEAEKERLFVSGDSFGTTEDVGGLSSNAADSANSKADERESKEQTHQRFYSAFHHLSGALKDVELRDAEIERLKQARNDFADRAHDAERKIAALAKLPPEDPTEDMLARAVRVASATGAIISEAQAHDIWQAMYDEHAAAPTIAAYDEAVACLRAAAAERAGIIAALQNSGRHEAADWLENCYLAD